MPTALIISYHYPPSQATGAHRLATISSHLTALGWNLIPITSQNIPHRLPLGIKSNGNLRSQLSATTSKLHIPYLRQLATLYAELRFYPDAYQSWKLVALAEIVEQILPKQKPDIIISSGPPISAHLIANAISRMDNIPWIAELRDLWSQNHAYPYSRWRHSRDEALEQRCLSQASALVTVSHGLQQQLIDLHHKPTYCIPTGYQPQPQLNGHQNSKLSLLYTGSIYYPYQDPEPLFTALFGIHAPNLASQLTIDFYCPPYQWLQNMIDTYSLSDIVHLHPTVNHEACLTLQQKADMLLLLKWNSPTDQGILTLKFWEYLAAGRPILAIGQSRDDELSTLLNHSDYAFTAASSRHIQLILKAALNYWHTHDHSLPYATYTPPLSEYTSHKTMEHYVQLLNQIILEGANR